MSTKNQKLINEITCDQPCHKGENDYCVLKEMVLHDNKYNERLLLQSACVNKFKYEESKNQNIEIDWKTAWLLWVEKGYAKIFGDVFDENDTLKTIYKKIMG